MKKSKKDVWESLFIYPSFNLRFLSYLFLIIVMFSFITYITFINLKLFNNISEQISALTLIIQTATFIITAFAAFYALRQLVETRFNSLDSSGLFELKNKHYAKAFDKWKEAFYIKPEPNIFFNLCETSLLLGNYEIFDEYMAMINRPGPFKNEIFRENYDQIILLYLKSIRNLLVKNQGEAEKYLSELVDLVKKEGLPNLVWDFLDLEMSLRYQDLTGECKIMGDNLISYLSKKIDPEKKKEFEKKKFATQVSTAQTATTSN